MRKALAFALACLVLLAACTAHPSTSGEPAGRGQVIAPPAEEAPPVLYPAILQKQTESPVGYIDARGNVVIEASFHSGRPFRCGLARVGMMLGDTWPWYCYIDENGDNAFGEWYRSASDFVDGVALVSNESNIYRLIDTEGKTVHQWPQGQGVYNQGIYTNGGIHDGRIRFGQDGLQGYTDTSGAVVIAPQFSFATDFSDGLALVAYGDGQMFYINTEGVRRLDAGYVLGIEPDEPPYTASSFSGGLAATPRGYIDTTGALVIELDNADALGSRFSEGLAALREEANWALYSDAGQRLLELELGPAFYVAPFSEGIAAVHYDGADLSGEEPGVTSPYEGIVYIRFINTKGDFINEYYYRQRIPAAPNGEQAPRYQCENGLIDVYFYNEQIAWYGYIDREGQIVFRRNM